ncbi:MAG TPA: hypothetical protein ENK67_03115 [Flavobacteriia bacterium]|nr:hypothetical protein [Flavobacteriia bacterium]
MASVKNLKKDLNYIFSDIIEDCYVIQLESPEKVDKAEEVIDEAITAFDDLIEKVNNKKVENRKAHLKDVVVSLEKKVQELQKKLAAI